MARTIRELLALREPSSSGEAILAPDRTPLSWSAVSDLTQQVVAELRNSGIGRRDVVAWSLPNGPEAASLFLAVASGAIAAPLNPGYRAAELRPYLADLKPALMVVPASGSPDAEEACAAAGIPVARLTPEKGAGDFSLPIEPVATPSTGSVDELIEMEGGKVVSVRDLAAERRSDST